MPKKLEKLNYEAIDTKKTKIYTAFEKETGGIIAIEGVIAVSTSKARLKKIVDNFYKSLGIEYKIKSIEIHDGQD